MILVGAVAISFFLNFEHIMANLLFLSARSHYRSEVYTVKYVSDSFQSGRRVKRRQVNGTINGLQVKTTAYGLGRTKDLKKGDKLRVLYTPQTFLRLNGRSFSVIEYTNSPTIFVFGKLLFRVLSFPALVSFLCFSYMSSKFFLKKIARNVNVFV